MNLHFVLHIAVLVEWIHGDLVQSLALGGIGRRTLGGRLLAARRLWNGGGRGGVVVGETPVGKMGILLQVPHMALVDAQVGGGAARGLHHTLAADAEVAPFQLGPIGTGYFPVDVPHGAPLVLLHQPVLPGVDLEQDVQLRLGALLLLLGGIDYKHISPRNPNGHSKNTNSRSGKPGGITGGPFSITDIIEIDTTE